MRKDVAVVLDAKEVKLRKLEITEHACTRKLWEEVFVEDTPEFLNYYYSVKAKGNEIYVIEEQDEIVSMLHLNPYKMRVGDELFQTHYIVAVATKETHRKRGLMRQLLTYAMQVMKDRGEPFTFLMPASEAIYKPFGFEFVYEQKRCNIIGKEHPDLDLELGHAEDDDCKSIAEFANDILKEYDVVVWRDEDYYRTLLLELSSEGGGILVAKKNGKIIGVFCYAKENTYIFHEPLFKELKVMEKAIYHITHEEVLCKGIGEVSVPMIMAKVLNDDRLNLLSDAKIFLNEVV